MHPKTWTLLMIFLLTNLGSPSLTFGITASIKDKMQQIKEGLNSIQHTGESPAEILSLMQQVPPLLKRGRWQEGEILLDEVLHLIDKQLKDGTAPLNKLNSLINYEFGNDQQIVIQGYSDHAMEPFLSRDGYFLFWNNRNKRPTNTQLHFARRIDDLTYQYQGELEGVNTKKLEGVPTLDERGNFYFLRGGDIVNQSCIKTGKFFEGTIDHEKPVRVDGVPTGKFAMGPEISPDGRLLYLVVSKYQGGHPLEMDLAIAEKIGEAHFSILYTSDFLLQNCNSEHLEYAPAISEDQLTLYFNRAEKPVDGVGLGDVGIYISRRSRITQPFPEPERIAALRGFVEGATVVNNRTIIYHKRQDVFKLHRINR